MPSFRSLLLAGLLLASISSSVATEPSNEKENREALPDVEAFQKLLDQVDPPALHAALHDITPDKFRHGIFKEDRTAVEAVHRDDASLASSIVSLAKRQGPSGNSTSGVSVSTSTVVVSASPTSTEIVISTVTPSGPGSVQTPSSTPSVAATAAPPTASASLSSFSLPLGPSLSSGLPITSPTSSEASTAADTSSVLSASNSENTPALSQTNLIIQTETLPGGGLTTVTQFTVVQATEGGSSPTKTSGSAPAGLQSSAALRPQVRGWEVIGIIGGTVGFAMAL